MEINIRSNLRGFDELRSVECDISCAPQAEGACLIKFGNTHVMCTASVEGNVPPFLRHSGRGWVTAEYSMLPRATHQRVQREITKGKPDGRTQEIQRLIGRSLRSVVDLAKLGERQIIIDCDVLRADGGTRTAAITGGYIALHIALKELVKQKVLKHFPLKTPVAAISCGVVRGIPMLDLEYLEDSSADVDANFIMSGTGDIIEVQMTGEKRPFSKQEYDQLYDLASRGIGQLVQLQRTVLQI